MTEAELGIRGEKQRMSLAGQTGVTVNGTAWKAEKLGLCSARDGSHWSAES